MAEATAPSPRPTEDPTELHERAEARRLRLRRPCMIIAGVGGLLGVLAALRAYDVSDLGGVFDLVDGRTGPGVGTAALIMALLSLAGAAAMLRSPALGSTLTYIGGCGGFLAIGGFWLVPGLLILVAANMALWAVSDPLWHPPAAGRRTSARTG